MFIVYWLFYWLHFAVDWLTKLNKVSDWLTQRTCNIKKQLSYLTWTKQNITKKTTRKTYIFWTHDCLKESLLCVCVFVCVCVCVGWGGGGGTGGSQSPAYRTPLSRLPYFFVPLSPDSRPLLCFSRYHVNHAVWLPVLIGSDLALSKKKLFWKSNHFALYSAIIEAAFLRYKFTPRSKIFSVLWTTVVRASSQEGLPWTDFSPPHRDRSKWSLTTFYRTRFVVLTENFDS